MRRSQLPSTQSNTRADEPMDFGTDLGSSFGETGQVLDQAGWDPGSGGVSLWRGPFMALLWMPVS